MNKSIRHIIFYVLISVFTNNVFAQETAVYTNDLQIFEQAKMLYVKKQFNPSIKLFESFRNENSHPNLNFECDLYIALSRLKLKKQLASIRLASLIRSKPDHHLSDEIHFELGLYYFSKQRFRKCVDYFEKIDGYPINNIYSLVVGEVEKPLIEETIKYCKSMIFF